MEVVNSVWWFISDPVVGAPEIPDGLEHFDVDAIVEANKPSEVAIVLIAFVGLLKVAAGVRTIQGKRWGTHLLEAVCWYYVGAAVVGFFLFPSQMEASARLLGVPPPGPMWGIRAIATGLGIAIPGLCIRYIRKFRASAVNRDRITSVQ
jgi:hypothetical protein